MSIITWWCYQTEMHFQIVSYSSCLVGVLTSMIEELAKHLTLRCCSQECLTCKPWLELSSRMELNETEFYSGIINQALNITNMLHQVRFIEEFWKNRSWHQKNCWLRGWGTILWVEGHETGQGATDGEHIPTDIIADLWNTIVIHESIVPIVRT